MAYKICVIKGDGIGPEVMESALKILDAVNFNANYIEAEAGYACYLKNGTSIPDSTVDICKNSDATLFGAVTSPPNIEDYKSAIVTLRKVLDLYVNLRPIVSFQIPNTRQGVNLTIVRENTEGMYSGIEEVYEDKVVAHRVITRKGSERIIRFAFEYAKNNDKKLTLVHKANVLRKSDGLFRQIGLDIAKQYPNVEMDEVIVDAMAMRLIKDPEKFNVIVTTNLFGDILSDEAAMLVGGLGVSPSGNIGYKTGIFEPTHGSAPKYKDKNYANPTAAILSSAMMLDFLKENAKADIIRDSVKRAFEKGFYTKDIGGNLGAKEFTQKIIELIDEG